MLMSLVQCSTVCLRSRLSIFVICVSRGMFLKDINKRFLLSKDEFLTPDNGKLMSVNVLKKGPLKCPQI